MAQGKHENVRLEDALAAQKLVRLSKQNEKLDVEVDRMKGQLIRLDDYKKYVIREVVNAKTRLLGIPAKMAPRLFASETQEELLQLLQTEIREVLNELADGVVQAGVAASS